jgi:type IV pilus assembly protein PilQ
MSNTIIVKFAQQSRFLGILLLLALGISTAYAQAPSANNRLESVDVQALPGQQVQLTLRMAGPAPQPLSFTIDNPARISLDLPSTALGLSNRRIDVRAAGIDSVVAAEAGGRTRVVVNMDRLMPYETRVSGNNIVVMVGSNAQQANATAVAESRPAASSSAPRSAAVARNIKSIDFRRGGDGTGRIVVGLTDPRTPINLRPQGNQIVVDFGGTDVPARLARRYDAMDFATPVSSFDVLRSGGSARIVINANGDYEQLAYQSDDQYVVEIQPVRKAQSQAEEKREYTGEKLNLNFQDIETRAVLQLLADASGQNIVVSDTVQGSVTLRLQNVPWDQALDIVLRTKGLDKRRQENVIIVAPSEELANREKAELAAKKDIQELAPLRSEYLQVNYAKAADLAELIKSQGGSLLSARGNVAVDERTNTLLLQDTTDKLADIRRLVSQLDIPVRQVLIEARIVIVNDDFKRELGVRAGFTGFDTNAARDELSLTSGSLEATDTGLQSALQNLADEGNRTVFPVNVPTEGGAPNRYNVNLPVQNPAGRLAFMVLGSDYIVDLELSALQAEGRGSIVSAPRVITSNQKEASIEAGVEIPYQEAASSGAVTISFKKAVLALQVTPQITPDNRIILDLVVKKDSVGRIVVATGGINVPSIDTREIKTQVLVNDGQTVVLGGIFETEERDTETKVPYIGDIPVFGRLFKTTNKTNDKDELLIFVTPKILREGVNVY